MKESRKYLNFIKDNLVFLVVPAVILAVIGGFYYSQKPIIYKTGRIVEFAYHYSQVQDTMIYPDQAVVLIRSENFGKTFKNEAFSITAVKIAPMTIRLEVVSKDKLKALKALEEVYKFTERKYPIKKFAEDTFKEEKPNIFFGTGLGIFIGGMIGLLAGLIKAYFKKY